MNWGRATSDQRSAGRIGPIVRGGNGRVSRPTSAKIMPGVSGMMGHPKFAKACMPVSHSSE